MNLANQNSRLRNLIEAALIEDLGMGDITTDAVVPSNLTGYGEIRVKEEGAIAGLEVAELAFQTVDENITLDRKCKDGTLVKAGSVVGMVDGPYGSILKAERTVLNILQRMSGIATITMNFVDRVKGTSAKIIDTRKTVPGLRLLDKLAVRIGGGTNHRFGLDDMVLIKDNHIAAAGSLKDAVQRCTKYLRDKHINVKVEVETKSLDEVREAVKIGGIDRIMLDNFSLQEIKKAVELINHKVEVEASGQVTLDNVRPIAETGVDFISIGMLTHSPRALDISMKVNPRNPSP